MSLLSQKHFPPTPTLPHQRWSIISRANGQVYWRIFQLELDLVHSHWFFLNKYLKISFFIRRLRSMNVHKSLLWRIVSAWKKRTDSSTASKNACQLTSLVFHLALLCRSLSSRHLCGLDASRGIVGLKGCFQNKIGAVLRNAAGEAPYKISRISVFSWSVGSNLDND